MTHQKIDVLKGRQMKCRLFKEAFRLFPIRQDARMGDRAATRPQQNTTSNTPQSCDFERSNRTV